MGIPGRVAISSIVMLLAGVAIDSATPLTMQVSPIVSRAPAVLTVRVTAGAESEGRTLTVVAESETYYRKSEVQLDGRAADPVNVFEFRGLPSGLYQVTGIVTRSGGARATVSRLARVEPGVGG